MSFNATGTALSHAASGDPEEASDAGQATIAHRTSSNSRIGYTTRHWVGDEVFDYLPELIFPDIGAADRLGLKRATLQNKMRRLQISG